MCVSDLVCVLWLQCKTMIKSSFDTIFVLFNSRQPCHTAPKMLWSGGDRAAEECARQRFADNRRPIASLSNECMFPPHYLQNETRIIRRRRCLLSHAVSLRLFYTLWQILYVCNHNTHLDMCPPTSCPFSCVAGVHMCSAQRTAHTHSRFPVVHVHWFFVVVVDLLATAFCCWLDFLLNKTIQCERTNDSARPPQRSVWRNVLLLDVGWLVCCCCWWELM